MDTNQNPSTPQKDDNAENGTQTAITSFIGNVVINNNTTITKSDLKEIVMEVINDFNSVI